MTLACLEREDERLIEVVASWEMMSYLKEWRPEWEWWWEGSAGGRLGRCEGVEPRVARSKCAAVIGRDWPGERRQLTELYDWIWHEMPLPDALTGMWILGGGWKISLPSHALPLSLLARNNELYLKLIDNDIQDMIQILPSWKHTSSYVELKNTIREGDNEIHWTIQYTIYNTQ